MKAAVVDKAVELNKLRELAEVEGTQRQVRALKVAETEMELLARAIQGDYVVLSPSIQTIYEEGNQSSHFQKVRDSWRIYKTLMRATRRRLKNG